VTARILEFRAVSKHYALAAGGVQALHEVDLSLEQGEFAALTGPSGSGKTTLLMLATLLDRASAGCVRFDGQDVTALDEGALSALRARAVGVVFQNYHLLPGRSVLENVLFRFRYLDPQPADPRSIAMDALELVGLADLADRPARLLSGGEMQRVAIARAVAVAPRLLAADEPTGNLDSESATAVMDCLSRLNRLGTTVLMVTHNESLLGYAGRRLQCRHGRLVA
jgi:putative ABC transport system ATP-binding protein